MTTAPEIERSILGWLSEIVGPDAAQQVDPESSFFEYGADSLALVRLGVHLSQLFDKTVSVDMIFDHPTPRALADFLADPPIDRL
jgi:acyl carrier protein